MRFEQSALPTTGLVTITRASELLDCSRQTIYRLHDEGKLELVKLSDRRTRVTLDSLRRFLTEITEKRSNANF